MRSNLKLSVACFSFAILDPLTLTFSQVKFRPGPLYTAIAVRKQPKNLTPFETFVRRRTYPMIPNMLAKATN